MSNHHLYLPSRFPNDPHIQSRPLVNIVYTDTYDRKWGYPYLTREFFEIISDTMADNVMLVLASRGDMPIAGALNLKGGNTLFGRNWGCDWSESQATRP